MFYYIISFISFCLGIYELIFTINNIKDMPFGVFAVSEKNCEILDKKKFNNIMIIQSLFISTYFVLISIIVSTEKHHSSVIYLSLIPLMNLFFAKLSKKYIQPIGGKTHE